MRRHFRAVGAKGDIMTSQVKKQIITGSLALAMGTAGAFALTPGALASDNWEFTTGKGETVKVGKGIFGNKSVKVEDRFGNKYENSNGWFGRKKKEVKILGNGYEESKNIFGQKSYKGKSILGDTVETKRSWFGLGPRTTKVNLSGVSDAAGRLMKSNSAQADPAPMPLPSDVDANYSNQ